MKTVILYLLAVAWCCAWFCSCGGSTDVSIQNSNEQSQNQASDEAQIQTAQEACSHCADKYANGVDDESLSDCVTRLGFDVSDC